MRRAALLAVAVGMLASAVVAAPRVAGGSDLAQAAATRPTITIKLGEFFFRPKNVTVHVGQRVRFLNVGKIQHTVADADKHWNIRSNLIKPRPLAHGQTQFVTFHEPGVVYYLCTFHPTLMRGRITVVR
jgi:plastocyanin